MSTINNHTTHPAYVHNPWGTITGVDGNAPTRTTHVPISQNINYYSLKSIKEELGDDFKLLAPMLHNLYEELHKIEQYKKTANLLGGG